MLANQQHAPQGIPTDLDLELQRRGQARGLTAEQREVAAAGLEVLGFDLPARRIRDLNRCLTRTHLRAAPEPAPRPGPKPRASPPRRPLLAVVSGSPDHRSSPMVTDEALFDALSTFAARWAQRPISDSALRMLQRLHRAAALHPRSR